MTGTVTFDTIGSSFNTLLGIYTGDSVTNLTQVASNDDINPATQNLQSSVTFSVVGMTMYHIAIDGFNGAMGNTTLHWNLTSPFAPLVAVTGPTVSYRILPQGEYQLVITGAPLERYRIELSDDLINWVPTVTTVADATGVAYFTDKSAPRFTGVMIGDVYCGPGQPTEGSVVPRQSRFYRATPIAAD